MVFGFLGLGGVSFEPEKDIPDLSGKVILVTGGNIGLGLETILQLSKHNPSHIYLAARSESKATAAIEEIQSKVPNAPITFLQCDLTSLPSVQDCAKKFDTNESRLDLLFLNAGIMAVPAATTEQGYEIQFGTNHTAEQKDSDVRVISLITQHLSRYGQSKLSNILFTKGLDKRYGERGIAAVSVHPGVVNTNLYATALEKYGVFGKIGGLVRDLAFTMKGEYYIPVGIPGNGNSYTVDEKLADELWEWTEKELKGYNV
ncbi:hypothetical protein DID88_001098 [Monilinia fructigena]|uniref:NAD(P)-binding protein n=1 Tax=Monilinia fructigena TaxID=38457 RepID=A0A395J1F9_9HELO|nr:hypothetical protein DID88_001098 [Monilinia fructigena]